MPRAAERGRGRRRGRRGRTRARPWHKDMITKHKEMLMTLTETHQQHIKLLSKLTQNMAPQEKTEDHDENGYAPGKALLQTTLPRQPTASCESNPGASSTAPAGMGLLAFIGGAGIWHIARRSQAPDARTPRKKKKKKKGREDPQKIIGSQKTEETQQAPASALMTAAKTKRRRPTRTPRQKQKTKAAATRTTKAKEP